MTWWYLNTLRFAGQKNEFLWYMQEYLMLAKTSNSLRWLRVQEVKIQLSLDTITVQVNDTILTKHRFDSIRIPEITLESREFGKYCTSNQWAFMITDQSGTKNACFSFDTTVCKITEEPCDRETKIQRGVKD
jgi:hypothetical protein